MVIISACLLGVKCRYNGESRPDERVLSKIPDTVFIPLCPEQLGGLPTPRPPARIRGGDGVDVLKGRASVIDSNGFDVTEQYIRGAREVARIARLLDIKTVIMKEMSPSCGVRHIKHDKTVISGPGVTSALLRERGITVVSSETIP